MNIRCAIKVLLSKHPSSLAWKIREIARGLAISIIEFSNGKINNNFNLIRPGPATVARFVGVVINFIHIRILANRGRRASQLGNPMWSRPVMGLGRDIGSADQWRTTT